MRTEAEKIERLRHQDAQEQRLFELITSPAIMYTGLVLLLEYLCTHPQDSFQILGINISGGTQYLSKDTAGVITAGLTAAMAANALGGGKGIADIIKVLK